MLLSGVHFFFLFTKNVTFKMAFFEIWDLQGPCRVAKSRSGMDWAMVWWFGAMDWWSQREVGCQRQKWCLASSWEFRSFFGDLLGGEQLPQRKYIYHNLGCFLKDEEEGIYEPHLDLSLPFWSVKCLVFQPTSTCRRWESPQWWGLSEASPCWFPCCFRFWGFQSNWKEPPMPGPKESQLHP